MKTYLNIFTKNLSSWFSPWEAIFAFSLTLNLFNYHSLDLIFSIFAIWSLSSAIMVKDKLWYRKLYFQPTLFNALVLIFFSSYLLGFFTSGGVGTEKMKEISNLRWILSFYCCFYAGSMLKKSTKRFQVDSIIFPVSLIAILIFHEKSSQFGLINFNNRLKGFYLNPNHFALATVLPWAFYLGVFSTNQKEKNTNKLIQICTLFLLSIGLIATYSRTSWMGAMAATLVAVFYSKNKRFKIAISSLIAIGVLLIASNVLNLKSRLLGSTDLSATGIEAGRISVWKASWQMFLDHPVFGVGIERASHLYPEYYQKLNIPKEFIVGNAHNQFLQVLSESGIIGFLSYLGIFLIGGIYFHRIYQQRESVQDKRIAFGALLVIVALLCSSFTDAPFRLHECRNFVLIILGYSFGYLYKEKETISKEPDLIKLS